MKLDIRSMAFGMGILCGAVVLLTGLANTIWSGYGSAFLKILASVYPGYKATGSLTDLITGVLYALADGGLFGLVLAWLYNRLLGSRQAYGAASERRAVVHYSPVEPKS
jgi:hypothetical protein